jgi:hypothetical protein
LKGFPPGARHAWNQSRADSFFLQRQELISRILSRTLSVWAS